ncbi:hypothetical protein BsWGS_14105 [Bradybaena similaris]
MIVHISIVACLLFAAVVKGTPPVITSFDKVMSVPEGTKVNLPLSTITCTDPDGDLTKVTIKSMSPASPCTNCFEILDCLPNECMNYRAGVGTLSYSSAQFYLLTIACDDNKGSSVTEVIQINVVPNSPPYFDPDVKFIELPLTGKEAPNAKLYNVDANDDEGDSITFLMTVMPSTSSANYRIDPLTGEIYSTVDLRSECGANDVTFLVSINDGKSTTGPLVISAPFSTPNVAPVGMNLETTVMIPEDSTGKVFDMKFTDGNNDPITYTYTSNNAAGAAQFNLDGKSPPKIDVVGALDYENSALRQTDYIVTASDGFCTSPPYLMKLRVTDVNEKPTINPVDSSIQVCEGQSEFDPGYKVTDPDVPDTVTWSLDKKTNNPGRFSINPSTGALITLVDYDVDVDQPDRSSPMPTTNTFNVVARDKGGLTATATVTVTFLDCNDNAPIAKEPAYEFATTECAAGGSRLGSISFTDKDISAPNNVIYYEGTGGAVQVGTGGEVIVNTPLPAGSVVTFNAYAWDRGQKPGQLRSVNPTVISVRFTPCPTPPPPVTQAPATPAPATPAPATAKPTTAAPKKYTKTEGDPNLPWIIIAGLLGAFMLALLAYMLWRYGRLCADACSKINCSKTCRGRPAKPRKVVERPVTPVRRQPMQREKPSRPPSAASSEPKEQEPERPGFIFGFWKQTYPNDDIKGQPSKTGVPAPGDMEYHYPHTYDPVSQPPAAQPTAPPQGAADAPQKNCIIQ